MLHLVLIVFVVVESKGLYLQNAHFSRQTLIKFCFTLEIFMLVGTKLFSFTF